MPQPPQRVRRGHLRQQQRRSAPGVEARLGASGSNCTGCGRAARRSAVTTSFSKNAKLNVVQGWEGRRIRAAPSAPRPWPSAETSSARGRRPLRIVKLVDDLRPSNRRLQAAENSLRMLNCWASVFSPVEESRARLGNKFGMNMSRSSLVLWADRRFAPPAVLSHHFIQ